MRTVSDIIGLWPSAEAFSKAIGLKYPSYGRVMRLRGRIPRVHWPMVAKEAAKIAKPISVSEIEAVHRAAPADHRKVG